MLSTHSQWDFCSSCCCSLLFSQHFHISTSHFQLLQPSPARTILGQFIDALTASLQTLLNNVTQYSSWNSQKKRYYMFLTLLIRANVCEWDWRQLPNVLDSLAPPHSLSCVWDMVAGAAISHALAYHSFEYDRHLKYITLLLAPKRCLVVGCCSGRILHFSLVLPQHF